MATTTLIHCPRCKQPHAIYIPKANLHHKLSMSGQFDDWHAVDAQDETNGNVESARSLATICGAHFVDYRDSPVFECQCGQEMNIDSFLDHSPNERGIDASTTMH